MSWQNFETHQYKITTDNTLLERENHITPYVLEILQEIRPDVEKGRKYLIPKLKKLCAKYPKVPVFKNYLSTVYLAQGNKQQAYAVNKWLVKEHSDYLFGKINLAAELLENEELEEIPKILGPTMEIGDLFPDRKVFHVEEVLGFHNITIRYLVAVGQGEAAETRFGIMEEIDPDHPKTRWSREILQNWRQTQSITKKEKNEMQAREVVLIDRLTPVQTTVAPVFHFPEQIGWLYEYDYGIDPEKIREILQLEPEKLREDLEVMLMDSVIRYHYYLDLFEQEEISEDDLYFPRHALLLLAEISSEKSLSTLFSLFKHNQDLRDFWFDPFEHEPIHNALFQCGKSQPEAFFSFLRLPNIAASNKGTVGEVLEKIIWDTDGRREHFISEYRTVLDLFLQNPDDRNMADTEAASFLVWDLTNLGYHEPLPEIKKLYELGLIDKTICGSYEEVSTDIHEAKMPDLTPFRRNIFENYQHLNNQESVFPLEDDDYDFLKVKNAPANFPKYPFGDPEPDFSKVNRNDPCPCGSGKKYKKCCLNK